MTENVHPRLLELLTGMADAEASDLHLVPGHVPMYRIHGSLTTVGDVPITRGEVMDMLRSAVPPEVLPRLDEATDLDFAIQLDGEDPPRRFRVNVFACRGEGGACFRAIPVCIPTLADLGFSQALGEQIIAQRNGLILITGITSSGKTASLAALIQILNARGGKRIITIEEPIEYIYPPMPDSIVTQREAGVDVQSFYDGLRFGLRQDPDVILVGEIRDRETAQLALSAAETGHLIFSTLHTSDAKGAITRLVDLFPVEQHNDVRSQLSMSLRYVVAQHLLPAENGGRRVLAMEAMGSNYAVRNAIRQGKIETLDSMIQSGRQDGMVSLDADLKRLMDEGLISAETARQFAKDPSEFAFAAGGSLH